MVELESSASRRSFLKGSATLAGACFATVGLADRGRHPGQRQDEVPPGDGVSIAGLSAKYTLVHRITMGFNSYEASLFDQLGFQGYLDYHLAPDAINDFEMDKLLRGLDTLDQEPWKLKNKYEWWQCEEDVTLAYYLRHIYSKRQLQEVMVEFWTDHFNVSKRKIDIFLVPWFHYQIRKNALGNFRTLLHSVSKTGAMMQYLDNESNSRYGFNENWARELLELHSMGVYSGYDETDIYTVMNCMTGWSWQWDDQLPDYGKWMYRSDYHYRYGGSFLNQDILPGDQEQGEYILNTIALHPNTATNLARKLCTKFLGEAPSSKVVKNVATAFIESKGDIKQTLRAVLTQENFSLYGKRKFKRPYYLFTSAMRGCGIQTLDPYQIWYTHLNMLRQEPFNWSPPNGYPDAMAPWRDNMLMRWRSAMRLVTNQNGDNWRDGWSRFPLSQITVKTGDGVANWINTNLMAGKLTAVRRTQLVTFLGPSPSLRRIREGVGLALSMPEFQYY